MGYDVLEKIRSVRGRIRQFGVRRIGVFGSSVRRKKDENIGVENIGDIDIIVEFEEGRKTWDNFIELAFFLEEVFGKKVDLLTQEALSPYIKPYVEREVIYEEI